MKLQTVDDVLEAYGQALEDAGRLQVEHTDAEHMRKVAQAVAFKEAVTAGSAVGKAEFEARTNPIYIDAVKRLKEVGLAAEKAKATATFLKSRLDVWHAKYARQTKQTRKE